MDTREQAIAYISGAIATYSLRKERGELEDQASKVLIGTRLDKTSIDKLSQLCIDACNPISDKRGTVEFRTDVAVVLASRAAKIAYKRAGF